MRWSWFRCASLVLLTSAACTPDLSELTSNADEICRSPSCDDASGSVPSACDSDPKCDAGTSRDGATSRDAGLTDVSLPDASDARESARPDVADTSPTEAEGRDAANDAASDAVSELALDAGSDASTSKPDASDASPPEAAAPPRRVLFTFDWQDGGVNDGGVASEWHGWNGTGTPCLINDDSVPNNPTPGALQLHVVWPTYDSGVFLEKQFVPNLDLSSYSRLHFWVKVPVVSPSFISMQGFANDGNGAGVYNPFVSAGSITPGVWFEVTTTLNPAPNSPLAQTFRIGLQIFDAKIQGEAGAAPEPMDIEVDNIWVD